MPEFSALFRCLNSRRAEYLLIGGYAVGVHGFARFTKDLDLWVGMEPDNARRVAAAAWDWGEFEIDPPLLCRPQQVVRLGVEPVVVDLITTVAGVEFETAYARRVTTDMGGVAATVISMDDLRTTKLATGDALDRADVDRLEKIQRRQQKLR